MNTIIETLRIDEMEMAYAKIGNGKKNFVILPGTSIHPVTPLAEGVGNHYKVFLDNDYSIYLFDRRSNVYDGYSIKNMAEDVLKMMRHLGIDKADLFGVSLGGMIAQYIAILRPDIVDHLMLGSTLSKCIEKTGNVVSEWIDKAKERDESGLIECFGKTVYSETTWSLNKEAIIASNGNISDKEYSDLICILKAIINFDCADELKNLTCKTIVIASKGDQIIAPESAVKTAEIIGCEIYFYGEEFGHGVYDESSDYADRLFEFCTK